MIKISLVMPYYNNAGMLAEHYKLWCTYPEKLRRRLECIIVDDGSPDTAAAQVPRPEGLPRLKIYRVTIDKPWHQHAARNIGAYRARRGWLLLTDMDHMVPEQTLSEVMHLSDGTKVYMFPRVDAPDLKPKMRDGKPHAHPNSFVMTRRMFWTVGGYDEDYCGIYGTDGLFRTRLFAAAPVAWLANPLIRYPREVIKDASTTTLARKEGRIVGAKQAVGEMKKREGRAGKPLVLSMPYVKAFP